MAQSVPASGPGRVEKKPVKFSNLLREFSYKPFQCSALTMEA
jgi:hypothetical protein